MILTLFSGLIARWIIVRFAALYITLKQAPEWVRLAIGNLLFWGTALFGIIMVWGTLVVFFNAPIGSRQTPSLADRIAHVSPPTTLAEYKARWDKAKVTYEVVEPSFLVPDYYRVLLPKEWMWYTFDKQGNFLEKKPAGSSAS
jgi:hypothetical protein